MTSQRQNDRERHEFRDARRDFCLKKTPTRRNGSREQGQAVEGINLCQ
jgi:hypothetical protein